MTAAKRLGPRLTVLAECDGCEQYHEPWGECMHSDAKGNAGKIGRYVGGDLAGCPLMPTRKLIGPCSECRDFGPELCPGEHHIGASAKMLALIGDRSFGCFHWKEKRS